MDPFVQQLADLCRAHVTRAKWVFVPTHAVGRTIGERIALGGTNWLNLRFVTPLDVALRMGAPFLVERGIDPSEEGLGPALMMRLLLDLPLEGGYFRPLADQPTMAQAMWTTVRELRMAGVKSGDLAPAAFESPAKQVELRALLASYEHFLATNNRGDMAVVYEEAVKHPDWCPIQPEDCWTELPDTIWPPLQRRLIDEMPGERILPRALDIPGATVPRRLDSQKVDRVAPTAYATPLAFLLTPASARPDTAGLELFHAGGREAEVEEVFRRILARGASLDHIEIACPSDAHVALVWEKALRHEWAVTLGPGIPTTQTRPGRALIGLCDWIETDFSAGHLRRLLQSGDLGLELEDEGFTAGQAARILSRAGAGWGRETYGLSLSRLRKSYEARAADPDESDEDRVAAAGKAELTAKVLSWVTGLIAAVPESDSSGRIPLQEVVETVVAFVERNTARQNALDHRAATSLSEYVQELQALGAFSCTPIEALRFIRERVQGLNVAPERPRPGHLFVCSLSQLGYSGRPHLYVVGLEEGRVFPTATEDPVLLDSERAPTSPALRLSTDRIDESVYAVLARLATWSSTPLAPGTATVTLSYSTRDTREFRETYASWLMLQAFRLLRGDPVASYQQMKAALGEPRSVLSADRQAASSSGGWWLRSVVGTADKGIVVVSANFFGIAAGRTAAERRLSEAFTEYDGFVPEAATALDPCAPGTALSVTELQSVAGCPFRFFLKRGLGLRPVEERERDKDVWLAPAPRGNELHALYASLSRRCRDEERRPDLAKDRDWLLSRAQSRLKELEREMPPASSEILDRESREFLGDVELFLEAEAANTASTPVAFEVSFGRPLDDDVEPLAREEPVEIDLGSGLTFRIAGRIDRIDQVGPTSFEVLDYKTGGFWRDDWNGIFDGGRRLQYALYGRAAVELLRTRFEKPKVVAGVYYFSSRKGRRKRLRIETPSQATVTAVLGDLRDVILAGTFVHAASKRDCKFCDYTAACDQSLEGRAEAKLEDASLVVFGRLGSHV
jgi:ATP-dependent helicase/nuclease subunit B